MMIDEKRSGAKRGRGTERVEKGEVEKEGHWASERARECERKGGIESQVPMPLDILVGLTLVPVSDRHKFPELQPYYLTCAHPSCVIPRCKEMRITCSSVAFSTVNLVWIGCGPQETERRERGGRM